MQILRNHWYDLGGILAVITSIYLVINFYDFTYYKIIVYINLISLFLHQLEKFRVIGTYPEMINATLYNSDFPDRYPLNTQTALINNIGIGWLFYMAAAVLVESAVWLGIATILLSFGSFIAHVFFFNIKGGTFFNAGMITSILQYLPVTLVFFWIVIDQSYASLPDYLIGIPLGVMLNYLYYLKMTEWLKDRDTNYTFPVRNIS